MGQNVVSQSNCRILLKCQKRKEWWRIFSIQINIEVFYKFILSFWVCVTRYAQSSQNKKFAYLCNILQKSSRYEVDLLLLLDTYIFSKLIVSFWVWVARHVQSTQNDIFAISQKMWRMKLIFCLQINLKGFCKLIHHFKCVCG